MTSWLLPLTRVAFHPASGPNGDTTHSRTPGYQFWFYQAISNTLKMRTKSVPETLANLHTLKRLPAPEHFIDFVKCLLYSEELVALLPISKLVGYPLVGCMHSLFSILAPFPHTWRPLRCRPGDGTRSMWKAKWRALMTTAVRLQSLAKVGNFWARWATVVVLMSLICGVIQLVLTAGSCAVGRWSESCHGVDSWRWLLHGIGKREYQRTGLSASCRCRSSHFQLPTGSTR